MTGKTELKYFKPTFIHHLINWCTYSLFRFLKIFRSQKKVVSTVEPVLVTGLFRSGTTITSRIIMDMGFSPGQDEHLLKAIGSRKELNPDGFLENHFFMDLSMYLFHKTNSWGDIPPENSEVEYLKLGQDDDNAMVKFSIIKLHDDRISNVNKLKTQLNGSASGPGNYLNLFFGGSSFIKNPHFAVLFPYFKKLFPNSKVVVVFRNPFDAVKSAQKISPLVNDELYNSYYENLCNEFKSGNKNILFFAYDNLVSDTDYSVKKLAENLNAKAMNPSYIKKGSAEGISKLSSVAQSAQNIYQFMLQNCINKNG